MQSVEWLIGATTPVFDENAYSVHVLTNSFYIRRRFVAVYVEILVMKPVNVAHKKYTQNIQET